jgi:hypothetical protein
VKGTTIIMGAMAIGAFLAAFLLAAQVRGEAQPPPGVQPEIEFCAPPSSQDQAEPRAETAVEVQPGTGTEPFSQSGSGDGEHAEGELCVRPSPGPERRIAGTIEGDPVLKLLPHDAIASVDQPRMVPASEAGGFMREDELVIGVSEGEEARAYSTWHLDRHEIVNDHLGEVPIAATW